jgi:hypothetical protein
MRTKTELVIAGVGAVLLLGVVLGARGRTAAGSAYNAVDGSLTQAVFSVPGMTMFQDSAGNFDPVNAGYEAGAAVHDAVVNFVGQLSTTPPPAEGMGAAQTNFGGYVSM